MIDKYNLVVPVLSKQMVHFSLKKETEKCLREGECKSVNLTQKPIKGKVVNKQSQQKDKNTSKEPTTFSGLFNFLKSHR